MVPKANLRDGYDEYDSKNYQRVKVRINGEIANVTTPIPPLDSLNKKFFKSVSQARIMGAEIRF